MSEPTYFEELIELGVPEEMPNDGFAFEDLFDEYVADTQKVWSHDRKKTVGASEAFGCERKNWFSKRGGEFGHQKDPEYHEQWGAVRRGDLMENHHIVPAIETGLRRRGMDLIMAGEGQDTIIDGYTSATLDGLIIGPPSDLLEYYGVEDIEGDSVVLEMKSFDPRIDITEEKAIHHGQSQMQMGLIRDKTDYNPEYAVILYVNASWIDDIRAFVVRFDSAIYKEGRRRNEKVFVEDDPAKMAPEGKYDNSCKYCPFTRACDMVSMKRVPPKRKALTKKEVEAQDSNFLQSLEVDVKESARLKAEKKKIEQEIEQRNEAIRQALIEANESRAVGEGWKVSYTHQSGQRRVSKAKMEEAGLDPDDYMEQGGGFEKLTITTN